MHSARKLKRDSSVGAAFLVHPRQFVFLDKKTGIRRFDVRANQDGSIPLDQAASLLAIQCLARHQSPREFVVMVQADEDVSEGLAGKAAKLIRTVAYTTDSGYGLSRRQREVLEGVAQNLSNKEIAAKLNVSERTVKFHVSALFQKFGVRTRVELLLRVLPDVYTDARLAASSKFMPVHDQSRRRSEPFLSRTTPVCEPGGQRVNQEARLAATHCNGDLCRPS